jgi:hypothetical protein
MKRSRTCAVLIAAALLATLAPGQSASKGAAALPDRMVIPVVLRTSIDAKDAKVDKRIELAATDDVRDAAGRIVIPKQAKLSGRVAEVVQWTKDHPESKVSIVVESAEWKGGSTTLRAFIAGDLKVYTALARPAPGAGEMAAAIEIVPPGERGSGPLPPNTSLARDNTVILQMATSKEFVTEVVSQAHNVRIEQGSTWSLRQLSQ